jgi:hypothetical protein
MVQLFVFACFAALFLVGQFFGVGWAFALMAPFLAYQVWHRITRGEWIDWD